MEKLLKEVVLTQYMGMKKDLSEDERHEIVQCLAKDMKITNIQWKLNGDFGVSTEELGQGKFMSGKLIILKGQYKI